MDPGQTFFLPRDVNIHRHVVISDPRTYPNDDVVFTNFTTLDTGKDRTCVVTRQEYSGLDHDSCIAYIKTEAQPLSQFGPFVRSRAIRLSSFVPDPVLESIRTGAGVSKEVNGGIKKILRRQGLIE